ncbi:MAG: PorT family protein [Acidobacteriota bacterium]|nr:PorT family protein [Acidobacteriota bacterium]MDH3529224.1 PorT family protein [Acidobacteriota bacterium]
MKPICAAIIAAFLFATVLGQQKPKTFVGFKGGVSIPQLSGGQDNELSRDFKSRVAPNFGVFADVGVNKSFSVQAELNYAGQGGKRTGIQPVTQPIPGLPPLPPGAFYYGDFKNTAELTYIEVPVLAKYKFGDSAKPRFYVNAGPYYGRLISAKTKTAGSSTLFLDRDGRIPILLPPNGAPLPPIPFDATTDIKNDVNSNNFGITGGGGYEIPFGKNYLQFDVRVSRGFLSIQRDTAANGNSKTGNIVVSVGYAFGVN